MKNYTVRKYKSQDFDSWNTFIADAKNATFLFHRNFMEYHADRFKDFSLMVFDDGKLVAVLPANRVADEVLSHQGLTYGGLVLDKKVIGHEAALILENILIFLRQCNIKKIIIKPIISIYHQYPAYETECFLIQKGAHLYRKDLNLAIDFSKAFESSKSKRKHYRKVSLDLDIKEETVFETFWDRVLEPRLLEKHNTKPVHSKEEMAYLHSKFPENIIQVNAYYKEDIIAGVTLFKFKNGIKSQYGATTKMGEKLRALDFLFLNLIDNYKDKLDFFDMGTVTENAGRSYNEGLLKQKQELGCAIYPQDFYALEL
ncbi:MAG TPA: FemAB family protein [Flavobacterium sp.]|jgi:hypothetical protein